jgi:TPR repeat protein
MKSILIIFTLFVSISACAGEPCDLASIGLTSESPLPRKLFYTGTCHYRNRDYEAAAKAWTRLSNMKAMPPAYTELQISSLNNLGYLLFFGYGIHRDQRRAVSYWEKAVSLGHAEAEYHLCHAYADAKESTYAPSRAVPHCRKAESIYATITNPSRDDRIILSQIRKYREGLANVIHH